MSVAPSRRRRRLRAVPPFRGNVARIQAPRPQETRALASSSDRRPYWRQCCMNCERPSPPASPNIAHASSRASTSSWVSRVDASCISDISESAFRTPFQATSAGAALPVPESDPVPVPLPTRTPAYRRALRLRTSLTPFRPNPHTRSMGTANRRLTHCVHGNRSVPSRGCGQAAAVRPLPTIHSSAVASDMPSTWRGHPRAAPALSPAANRRYTSNERPPLVGRAAPQTRLPWSRKCRVSP